MTTTTKGEPELKATAPGNNIREMLADGSLTFTLWSKLVFWLENYLYFRLNLDTNLVEINRKYFKKCHSQHV